MKPILALSALACECARAAPLEAAALDEDGTRALADARLVVQRQGRPPKRSLLDVVNNQSKMPDELRARLDIFLRDARSLLT